MKKNKVIIISPVSRVKNLKLIKKSINFDFIYKWIIVYDSDKVKKNINYFKREKNIKEFIYYSKSNEVQGNGQRNFALNYIEKKYIKFKPFIYFLDDDNIVHSNLYNLIPVLKKKYIYTFDQQRTRYILSGAKPKIYHIDLAMFLGDFELIKKIRFKSDTYNADGKYIEDCYKNNKYRHIYIDEVACFYNYLKRNLARRVYYIIIWYLKILTMKLFKNEITKQYKP